MPAKKLQKSKKASRKAWNARHPEGRKEYARKKRAARLAKKNPYI